MAYLADYPGVASDNMGGLLSQNFTAYPFTPDPTDGPVLTAVSATDTPGGPYDPLPAGDYDYTAVYVDETYKLSASGPVSSITLDGTQVVQIAPPPSIPVGIAAIRYARSSEALATFLITGGFIDPAELYIDSSSNAQLLDTNNPVPGWNQTFPTATLGGTVINGTLDLKAGLVSGFSEFGKTPPAFPPAIVGNVTSGDLAALQTVVGALLTALDAKGTILKSTT